MLPIQERKLILAGLLLVAIFLNGWSGKELSRHAEAFGHFGLEFDRNFRLPG
jgi:hypothetical protein